MGCGGPGSADHAGHSGSGLLAEDAGARRGAADRCGRIDGRSRPGHGDRLRHAGSAQVTWLYGLAGSASLGLLVYLIYALLNAEEF